MVCKWYILPIGGLYATYHLFGEPETTIDENVALGAVPLDCRKKSDRSSGRCVAAAGLLAGGAFVAPELPRQAEKLGNA